jgi:hypothetical protein
MSMKKLDGRSCQLMLPQLISTESKYLFKYIYVINGDSADDARQVSHRGIRKLYTGTLLLGRTFLFASAIVSMA